MREDLLRFNNKLNLLFFDYETCSLNLCSSSNKPWQLAFIAIKDGRVIEKVDYHLDWEDLKVSPAAAKITGFNLKSHKKKAIDPAKALKHFETYLYDPSFWKVGHNILGFDVYIHGIHRRLLNLPVNYEYMPSLIDTACLAKAIKKDIHFKNESLLSWQYKLNHLIERGLKVNLQQCCKDYSIDFDPSLLHDALYDIEKNYEIFQKMIWEVEI